jgi:hypothetical protein
MTLFKQDKRYANRIRRCLIGMIFEGNILINIVLKGKIDVWINFLSFYPSKIM